jgi:hypothetical protein
MSHPSMLSSSRGDPTEAVIPRVLRSKVCKMNQLSRKQLNKVPLTKGMWHSRMVRQLNRLEPSGAVRMPDMV